MSYYGWLTLERLAALQEDADFWERWMDRLHPDEKAAIVYGEIGIIKRPVEPTWAVGEWMEVASNLWLRPHKPKFTHRGWRITYDLRDFRVQLVKRVPSMFEPPELDAFGYPVEHDKEAIEHARIDGNYTAAHELAIPESDESLDDVSQRRITKAVRARERQAAAGVIVAAQDVMAAVRERAAESPEFKREARLLLHRMQRETDRFIERQKRKSERAA